MLGPDWPDSAQDRVTCEQPEAAFVTSVTRRWRPQSRRLRLRRPAVRAGPRGVARAASVVDPPAVGIERASVSRLVSRGGGSGVPSPCALFGCAQSAPRHGADPDTLARRRGKTCGWRLGHASPACFSPRCAQRGMRNLVVARRSAAQLHVLCAHPAQRHTLSSATVCREAQCRERRRVETVLQQTLQAQTPRQAPHSYLLPLGW